MTGELPERLDLSVPEDLALFMAVVPNWPELALGLDWSDPEKINDEFAERVQRAWDEAIEQSRVDRCQDQE